MSTTSMTSKEKVYHAIVDLMSANRPPTRKTIAMETGLKLSVVDDHIKNLKDDGRLSSPTYGVFELVHQDAEDRAVSVTHMPNGRCKLEIGEMVIDLSLREGRMVGMASAGIALLFGK